MKMLFYRYGSICEPDIITAFSALDITIIEEKTEIYDKKISESARVKLVNELLIRHSPVFVFSINFFPSIAEVCQIHNTLYLCWSVDCPVMDFFNKAIQYPTNRIFLFDKEQFNFFHPYNPDCIFYLPLASSVDRFDSVTKSITQKDKTLYSADIAFVGSLYSEKNSLKKLKNLSAYVRGYIDGITDAALQIYGYNLIEETITDELVAEFRKADALPSIFSSDSQVANAEKYAIAHRYIGYHTAEVERIRTLNKLAEHFQVDLYTASDTAPLHSVHTHAPIESLFGMPKVFHLSKINLNMTIKPIKSGLPLRIFDIMGCGGFLMTNYQAELTDFFEIGRDLEAYSSLEELIDKCAYYLQHEDERKLIALNGYEAVKQFHTYPHRIAEMIRIVSSTL